MNALRVIVHHKVFKYAWLVCCCLFVAYAAGVVVDIDHVLYYVFGWGWPTHLFPTAPGKFLHEPAFYLGIAFILGGYWACIASYCRSTQIRLLK